MCIVFCNCTGFFHVCPYIACPYVLIFIQRFINVELDVILFLVLSSCVVLLDDGIGFSNHCCCVCHNFEEGDMLLWRGLYGTLKRVVWYLEEGGVVLLGFFSFVLLDDGIRFSNHCCCVCHNLEPFIFISIFINLVVYNLEYFYHVDPVYHGKQ